MRPNKQTNKQLITLLLPLMMIIAGCQNAKLSDTSVLAPAAETTNESELDQWITQSITQPYQIEVLYRWDEKELLGTYVYPPQEEKVKSVLETVKYLFLESFELPAIGDLHYLKGKLPIRIKMYGGSNLDPNGVELLYNPLGTPVEMCIYNVNSFDPSDPEKVFLLMRSVFHQFAKRMLELYPYDRDKFYRISGHRYLSSTEPIAIPLSYQQSYKERFGLDTYAGRRGCYTMYALLSPEDDMAEMISATLLSTPQEIEYLFEETSIPDGDPNPEVAERYAREAALAHNELLEKQAFLSQYIKVHWGLDLTKAEVTILRRVAQFIQSKEEEE
ncbi:putative zinc-binding metallopeptidase [Porphyromonas somerae]|uniref:putative zinc-binding metallopeptidase n=1 Tax=Porphyromonas somerae TaxID=322095 RepID=UPI0003790DFE|nr:putative zinc-binding metallopeptidase [Porphyromonas somerae]